MQFGDSMSSYTVATLNAKSAYRIRMHKKLRLHLFFVCRVAIVLDDIKSPNCNLKIQKNCHPWTAFDSHRTGPALMHVHICWSSIILLLHCDQKNKIGRKASSIECRICTRFYRKLKQKQLIDQPIECFQKILVPL